MKQKFSKHWIASKQPRKQRKYRANAPLHIRHKLMAVNLNKTLREKYGKRSFPVKKGDSVKIMRGEFKKKTGKIDSVNLKKLRVMIEGIFRTKKDGVKVSVYFNPSNLQIKELNLEDAKRKKALERKTATGINQKSDNVQSKESMEKNSLAEKSDIDKSKKENKGETK